MTGVELNGKLTGQFQDGDYTESGWNVDAERERAGEGDEILSPGMNYQFAGLRRMMLRQDFTGFQIKDVKGLHFFYYFH